MAVSGGDMEGDTAGEEEVAGGAFLRGGTLYHGIICSPLTDRQRTAPISVDMF